VWDASVPNPATGGTNRSAAVGSAAGEPTADPDAAGSPRPAWESARHSDIRVDDTIRESLWDAAGWKGVAFLWPADAAGSGAVQLPAVCLMFGDANAAADIFRRWRATIGPVDRDERLRVLIVRAIRSDDPHAYRVLVGPSTPALIHSSGTGSGSAKYLVRRSRVQTMVPPSDYNLRQFLVHYERSGRYWLMPAEFRGADREPRLMSNLRIEKRQLAVRTAGQISPDDPDSAALLCLKR
jgi:hypothetical protein